MASVQEYNSPLNPSCLLLLSVFLLVAPVYADEPAQPPVSAEAESGTELPVSQAEDAADTSSSNLMGDMLDGAFSLVGKAMGLVDTAHGYLSMQMVDFVDSVDLFFGDERMEESSHGSYLRFAYGVQAFTDGDVDNVSRIKVNIHMPRLQRRLNLMIETDRDSEGNGEAADAGMRDSVFDNESSDVSTALRYFWKETRKWKFSADAGVVFVNPLDKFVRLRVRRNFSARHFNMRLSETLFWYDLASSGATTLVDLETRLAGRDLFRISSEATWTDTNEYFDLVQVFGLYHEVDRRQALLFQFGANGITEPDTHVTTYFYHVRWRRRLNREWLFAEVKPAVRFHVEDHFRPVPSITLMLEAFVGNY